MSAVDTSVAVPALLAWHEHHEVCRQAAAGAAIPAHARLETYSVLTRLPSPHRIDGSVAHRLLDAWFTGRSVLVAPASVQRTVVDVVAAAGHEGGTVYDALIGITARAAGEVLVTRDRRAVRLYDDLGVEHELLES